MELTMTTDIRSILVPSDFSASSDHAILYATALASRLRASLHVIHVLDGFVSVHKPWDPDAGEPAVRHERLYQQARRRLAASVARLPQHVPATFEVRSGTAAGEIAKAAIDYGADLIVMGTHGRSGLQHVVLGSVAEDVIRRAVCPVLTIRDTHADGIPAWEEAVPGETVAA
jgi:nucleotide-binding universal stress UspA family protein